MENNILRRFWGWKPKKNIEPHQGITGSYRKGAKWIPRFVEYQQWKGKKVKKLWWNLSSMPINTGLDLKARFVWGKRSV